MKPRHIIKVDLTPEEGLIARLESQFERFNASQKKQGFPEVKMSAFCRALIARALTQFEKGGSK